MTSTCENLSCAETAKLVRAALKRGFPEVKFSVTSKTYAGGASINVRWTDGPITREVEAIAGRFAGGDFDGMIDMKTYREHYLTPDGIAIMASTPGTAGSGGVFARIDNPLPPFEARRVQFGADFVFCTRHLSPAATAKLAAVYDGLNEYERLRLCHGRPPLLHGEGAERKAWIVAQHVAL